MSPKRFTVATTALFPAAEQTHCSLVVFNSEGVTVVVEVLLYVHRNRRLTRDGSPGRPPRHSDSSWVLRVTVALHSAFWISTEVVTACFSWCMAGATNASGETLRCLCAATPPSTPGLGLWHHQVHQDLGCVTTYWHLQQHHGLGCVQHTNTADNTKNLGRFTTYWHLEHQGLGCITTH